MVLRVALLYVHLFFLLAYDQAVKRKIEEQPWQWSPTLMKFFRHSREDLIPKIEIEDQEQVLDFKTLKFPLTYGSMKSGIKT